ncbi:Uncharacterised protein [Mycobacteroides abscessus subsp. abscessus]|nr:Uncharacterised protein [Mycobacteroides abscessus subsp. abscessus]
MKGSGGLIWYLPWQSRTSGKLAGVASTFTRTSPGPAVGVSTSSRVRTSRGSPSSLTRQAFMNVSPSVDYECRCGVSGAEGCACGK